MTGFTNYFRTRLVMSLEYVPPVPEESQSGR